MSNDWLYREADKLNREMRRASLVARGPSPTGWYQAGAWTYVTATTFTVAGNATSKYGIGDRIRFKQSTGTWQYGKVSAAPSYNSGTGTTTIAVAMCSGSTLANEAITDQAYSKAWVPQGFAPDVEGLTGQLAEAQTAKAHKANHQNGGSDEISVAGLSGVLAEAQNADHLQGYSVAATAPAEGSSLRYSSGAWRPDASGSTGVQFYPLTTPATAAAWNGTAKTTGDNGMIDLSAVFGLPAGIKAVAVTLTIKDETTGVWVQVGPSSISANAVRCRTQVANIYSDGSGVCPCDTNGDIYWGCQGELDVVYLNIWGYWL